MDALAEDLLSVEVVGTGISEEYVAVPRDATAAAGSPVHFDTADIPRDELPTGPFVLIAMHDVFEHLAMDRLLWTEGQLLKDLRPIRVTLNLRRGPPACKSHAARSWPRDGTQSI